MMTTNDFGHALQQLLNEYQTNLRQIDISFDRKLNDLKAEKQANRAKIHNHFVKKLLFIHSDQIQHDHELSHHCNITHTHNYQ